MALEDKIVELLKQLKEEERLADKRAKQLFNLFTPENWIAPTLLNSWVNYGTPYAPAGYFKDAFGIVHLRGLVKDGTVGYYNIFVLPTGYRPPYDETYITLTGNNTAGRLQIYSNGNVQLLTGNNSYASLYGITFRIN